ncbi:MAG: hypothetical protein ACYCXW_05840 [Solirubrobacteraceae bacterium]
MAGRAARGRPEARIEELIAALEVDELREVVSAAVDRHDDVERQVRLVAARAAGGLAQLRAEVDRGLRIRRFLGYRESGPWARAARPILSELEKAVDTSPSKELVELLQRAVAHVVKVILHADDSDGLIGDLARDLLELHARACDAGVADPVKLAAWMVKFRFTDQDFFEVDPVRYANALGERGLAAYREAVDTHTGTDSFAVRYARDRLAILDGDVDAIVEQLGGDLTTPYQFIRVAEAMAELGLHDEVLAWSTRGIAQTRGWQVAQLYDLACGVHARRAEPLEVLALRRAQHERMPSSSTYRALRTAAEGLEAWPLEQAAARATLQRADVPGFVDALLDDGDVDLAWTAAVAAPQDAVGFNLWLRLAETSQQDRPADALAVYQRLADEVLERAERRAYRSAAWILQRAQVAAQAADMLDEFTDYLARLREQHRRRPTLIAILDKANFR